MIGDFEYELNGVKYHAAHRDQKYSLAGEPLRPANSQIVQGQSNLFNLRPDLLRWRIDDWSGGQGQFAFDGQAEAANRYWKGFYVDGFTRYGVLSPGWDAALDTIPDQHHLVVAQGSLYAIEAASTGTDYVWNGSAWTSTGPTYATTHHRDAVSGDDDYLYYYDGTTGKIYKDDGTTNTEIGNAGPTVTTTTRVKIISFSDYLILVAVGASNSERGVWQLSKSVASTTAMTLIYDMAGVAYESRAAWATALGPNRVFIATPGDDDQTTQIHEVTPDDASATGFGYVRATIPGVYPDTMWYSNGFIWIAGRINENSRNTLDERGIQLVYLDLAQSTYGSVPSVWRDAADEVQAVGTSFGGGVTGSLSHIVTLAQESANVEYGYLWQIDQSSGGVQQVGRGTGNDAGLGLGVDGSFHQVPISYGQDVFWAAGSNNGTSPWGGIFRWSPDLTPDGSYFITSWYEFGLADDKSLSSVELTLRKGLPADWNIRVFYQADDDTGEDILSWTEVGTGWTTDGETNKIFEVSSAQSQVTFNRVRFAVLFDWTGGGSPTNPPELTTFEATCQVAKKFRVREVWLQLSDEHGTRGRKGHIQIDNIRAAGDLGTVVNFKDGMINRHPSTWEETDVLVDAYAIELEKPGEGVAYVRLLESY